MLSLALFYILAVICSARRTHALPLYPDASLEPQEELIQKLVAEVEDGENAELTDQREVKNLYPLLMQRNAKDSVQQDTFVNMVDDLKAVVLKLAAADKLRSQGFLRSEQNLPKTNKRACFWKYCVTN
ncbi:urotensin-related peptide 1 [Salvelinus namaycush]|uniref:Urotensin-related peptide 1 n=1 Tax=Salvelinus namaycush TaxID=8040 RepID=A0A8U1F2S1_SALNM|nr:urotensin-related peptide 1 [Salvelinus namaycush]